MIIVPSFLNQWIIHVTEAARKFPRINSECYGYLIHLSSKDVPMPTYLRSRYIIDNSNRIKNLFQSIVNWRQLQYHAHAPSAKHIPELQTKLRIGELAQASAKGEWDTSSSLYCAPSTLIYLSYLLSSQQKCVHPKSQGSMMYLSAPAKWAQSSGAAPSFCWANSSIFWPMQAIYWILNWSSFEGICWLPSVDHLKSSKIYGCHTKSTWYSTR